MIDEGKKKKKKRKEKKRKKKKKRKEKKKKRGEKGKRAQQIIFKIESNHDVARIIYIEHLKNSVRASFKLQLLYNNTCRLYRYYCYYYYHHHNHHYYYYIKHISSSTISLILLSYALCSWGMKLQMRYPVMIKRGSINLD